VQIDYDAQATKLFVALAGLMLDEEVAAGPPCVQADGVTIYQNYGMCPANSGVGIHYRAQEDGTVLMWDDESDDYPSIYNEDTGEVIFSEMTRDNAYIYQNIGDMLFWQKGYVAEQPNIYVLEDGWKFNIQGVIVWNHKTKTWWFRDQNLGCVPGKAVTKAREIAACLKSGYCLR